MPLNALKKSTYKKIFWQIHYNRQFIYLIKNYLELKWNFLFQNTTKNMKWKNSWKQFSLNYLHHHSLRKHFSKRQKQVFFLLLLLFLVYVNLNVFKEWSAKKVYEMNNLITYLHKLKRSEAQKKLKNLFLKKLKDSFWEKFIVYAW